MVNNCAQRVQKRYSARFLSCFLVLYSVLGRAGERECLKYEQTKSLSALTYYGLRSLHGFLPPTSIDAGAAFVSLSIFASPGLARVVTTFRINDSLLGRVASCRGVRETTQPAAHFGSWPLAVAARPEESPRTDCKGVVGLLRLLPKFGTDRDRLCADRERTSACARL
jgi:hypothetical protein